MHTPNFQRLSFGEVSGVGFALGVWAWVLKALQGSRKVLENFRVVLLGTPRSPNSLDLQFHTIF